MGDAGIGWIAAIIIGGIAGWLAEQFMKSDMGMLMNIVLGIAGAAIASAILSFFGIVLGGWVGYLIAGFIGACLLIWIVRAIQGTRRRLRTATPNAGIPRQPTTSQKAPCYKGFCHGPSMARRTETHPFPRVPVAIPVAIFQALRSSLVT